MNKLLIAMLHRAEVPVGKIPLAGEIEYRSWSSNRFEETSIDLFAQSMREEVAHKGYKAGEVLGYSTYDDGRVASTWEATGSAWEDTFMVTEEDVKVEQRRAIMRSHAPECNIVLGYPECNIISPCTCR